MCWGFGGEGSGMCAGGSGAGGFFGLGRAGFGIWSIGTITTSGSNGGFCCGGSFVLAWLAALVFIGFSSQVILEQAVLCLPCLTWFSS